LPSESRRIRALPRRELPMPGSEFKAGRQGSRQV